MQPRFDGPFVEPQNTPHFFGAQSFHVAEHQHHPVLARQLCDGAIEYLPQFFIFKRVLRAEALHRDLQGKLAFRCRNEFGQG